MAYAANILFDDRPFIEIGLHEMRRRPDDLHSARMRLMIGFGALEAGQEAVMDVDAAPRERLRKAVRENLHIARKNGQFGAAFRDDRQEARLLCLFTLTHRSEEHTSELQSLMRISYAVFCLKKKKHIMTQLST